MVEVRPGESVTLVLQVHAARPVDPRVDGQRRTLAFRLAHQTRLTRKGRDIGRQPVVGVAAGHMLGEIRVGPVGQLLAQCGLRLGDARLGPRTGRHPRQRLLGAIVELAQQGGLRASIITAIADGRRPEGMAGDEETLYTFCDELHRTQGISDATYARAVRAFGEQGVIDILGISGYYTMLAMVLNTARTPVPAGHEPALRPYPR